MIGIERKADASRNLELEPVDVYRKWQEAQHIPIIRGFFIEDICAVPLARWDLKGGDAAFINLEGTEDLIDAYVCEIPPGGHLKPQRHLYEEMIYVVNGLGATTVWQRTGGRHTFEWGPGSLFAVPLNAYYQHFNGGRTEPVRYLAVTNACFMMNIFHNTDLIFGVDFDFLDRFNPLDEGYFTKVSRYGRNYLSTNFVPDVRSFQLDDYSERGAKGTNVTLDMAGNTMGAHISEFPVGTYKKAHRHGPGAHVIILTGEGYSLLWREGKDRVGVNWKAGSMLVPPDHWFHQHFNCSQRPARYLALRRRSWRFGLGKAHERHNLSATDIKRGGRQIEYEDEDPAIHGEFESELAKAGVLCRMRGIHPLCSAEATAEVRP